MKINIKNLLYSAIIFISVFIIYYCVVRFFYPNIENSGQFGDTFGGVNAIFSGLAFFGIIYTILLQREELGLQRKELKLTRKELERAAEAQEKSQEALSKQAESLKATAKLNGLSAIANFHATIASSFSQTFQSGEKREEINKALPYIEKIKTIIKIKQ